MLRTLLRRDGGKQLQVAARVCSARAGTCNPLGVARYSASTPLLKRQKSPNNNNSSSSKGTPTVGEWLQQQQQQNNTAKQKNGRGKKAAQGAVPQLEDESIEAFFKKLQANPEETMAELDFSDFQEIGEIDEENYSKTPAEYLAHPDTKPFPFMTMEPLEPEFYPPVADFAQVLADVVRALKEERPTLSGLAAQAPCTLAEGIIVDAFVPAVDTGDGGTVGGVAFDIGQPWFFEVEEREPLHFVEKEPRTASKGLDFKKTCVELLGYRYVTLHHSDLEDTPQEDKVQHLKAIIEGEAPAWKATFAFPYPQGKYSQITRIQDRAFYH